MLFRSVNAAYPYGVRLWDEDTGNTLEIRLCKSLDDAIYSAKGAMCSQRASRVAGWARRFGHHAARAASGRNQSASPVLAVAPRSRER